MTQAALVERLTGRFEADFATQLAEEVLAADAVEVLYAVVTACYAELPAAVRHRILFRSAYVLEKVYFEAPQQFRPYADAFIETDFSVCADASARRHFAKIMADLLLHEKPESGVLERIAETASDWAVDPASKIAVRIWSIEILKSCRRIPWVAELWPDLLETMYHDASAGILRRMRNSWQKGDE